MRKFAAAFELVGVNAIFAFVASGIFARLLVTLEVRENETVKDVLYQQLFVQPLAAAGLADPRLASLAYAIAFVAVWWLILWGMHRRGWVFRV